MRGHAAGPRKIPIRRQGPRPPSLVVRVLRLCVPHGGGIQRSLIYSGRRGWTRKNFVQIRLATKDDRRVFWCLLATGRTRPRDARRTSMEDTILRSSLIGIALGAMIAGVSPAAAEMVNFKGDLKGSAESPPNDSKGSGSFTATYDTA